MKDELPILGSQLPPLLSLTFVLQQFADNLLLGEVGLSLGMVRIMSGLSPAAATSQRRLALHLSQTEANISRQLKILKKEGLVSVTKNKKDGRQRDVLLTKKGERKYRTAEKLLLENQREFDKLMRRQSPGFN